jgi:RNA polymerase sigma factor (sigma-70 family)
MSKYLDNTILKARNGNKEALGKIVLEIQDMVFNLAVRMLWTLEDAEDATQEIIIKVITNLATFRGDSKLTTWVFQIATNYLLTTRKHIVTNKELTFERFSADINSTTPQDVSLSGYGDLPLLEKELKIGCTNAILFCLDKKSRVVFILSSIFEINNKDASDILNISFDNYRQILSRTNKKITSFIKADCGLVNENAKCKCRKRIKVAIDRKRLNPEKLIYSRQLIEKKEFAKTVDELDELDSIALVYKSNPYYCAPEKIIAEIKEIIQSDKYQIIQN